MQNLKLHLEAPAQFSTIFCAECQTIVSVTGKSTFSHQELDFDDLL